MRAWGALCLLVWCLALLPSGSQAGQVEEADRLLRSRLEEVLADYESAGQAVTALERDLAQLETQARQAQVRAQELGARRDQIRANLPVLDARLRDTSQRLEQLQAAYDQRLRAHYLYGADGTLWALASSRDLRDFLERAQAHTRLLESDVARLRRLRDLRRELSQLSGLRRAEDQRLAQAGRELDQNLAHVTLLAQQKKHLLANLDARRRDLSIHIQALREAQTRLARAFALDRQAQPISPQGGPASPPVEGDVTGRAGPHGKGVILQARPDAPVRAPWPGKVIHAGPLPGYDRVVILDHGNRLHSVLAYLGTVSVEVGQELTAGQLIGALDGRGKLYLEVRSQARLLDPSQWLGGKP